MRIFSFIAILGTTFTAWYMVAEASAAGVQPRLWNQAPTQGLRAFVEGGTALLFVYGGHAMLMSVLQTRLLSLSCLQAVVTLNNPEANSDQYQSLLTLLNSPLLLCVCIKTVKRL